MKVGIVPFNVGVASAEELVARARTAEAVGLESIWTFEHVVVPLEYASRYPYNASGKMGAQPETTLVDPLIALTAAAATTSTIRLGTGISILPQANPLLLAKQAASLDYVSGGRLMLGFGAGWLREVTSDGTLSANGVIATGGAGVKYWLREDNRRTLKRFGLRAEFRVLSRSDGLSLDLAKRLIAPAFGVSAILGF